jgi:hypothetical protein
VNCGEFLSADCRAAKNATTVLTDTCRVIDVRGEAGSVAIFLDVTADSIVSDGTLSFTFQRSPDGTTWHNLADKSVDLSNNETTQNVSSSTSFDLDVSQTRYLRLYSVTNTDTDTAGTATINAYWSAK